MSTNAKGRITVRHEVFRAKRMRNFCVLTSIMMVSCLLALPTTTLAASIGLNWKTVRWNGFTGKIPTWWVGKKSSAYNIIWTTTPPKGGTVGDWYFLAGYDPETTAYSYAHWVAAITPHGVFREWPSHRAFYVAYKIPLAHGSLDARLLAVSDPKGPGSIIMTWVAPSADTASIRYMMDTWSSTLVNNPLRNGSLPSTVSAFVPPSSLTPRDIDWKSVASGAFHASVPIDWMKMSYAPRMWNATFGGGSLLASFVRKQNALQSLFMGWTSQSTLYQWSSPQGYVSVVPNKVAASITEVVPWSSTQDIVVQVTVSGKNLTQAARIMENWNWNGKNLYRRGSAVSLPKLVGPKEASSLAKEYR